MHDAIDGNDEYSTYLFAIYCSHAPNINFKCYTRVVSYHIIFLCVAYEWLLEFCRYSVCMSPTCLFLRSASQARR